MLIFFTYFFSLYKVFNYPFCNNMISLFYKPKEIKMSATDYKENLKLFLVYQNNSGGSFCVDYSNGTGERVFVLAKNEVSALDLLENKSVIYFDGVSQGLDCECCGDRWCRSAYEVEDENNKVASFSSFDEAYDFVVDYVKNDIWLHYYVCYLHDERQHKKVVW